MVRLVFIGYLSWLAAGEVLLSDGEKVSGEIDLGELTIYVPQLKRHLRLKQEEIALIRTEVEQQKMLQAWVFVEESSRKKIKLPEFYPVRWYRTEVILKSGQKVRGHVLGKSFYVLGEEEDRRFILRRQHRGKKGQALEDLVFVREVRLGPVPKEARLAGLCGKVKGAVQIFAYRLSDPAAVSARVGKDGRFEVRGLIAGSYLLLLRGKEKIALGTLGKKPKEEVRKKVLAQVKESREFFTDKKVLCLGQREGKVWALVGMARFGRTTAGNQTYRRFELWLLSQLTPRWEIEKRVYLWREVWPRGARPAWPEVRTFPELADFRVRAGEAKLPAQEKIGRFFAGGRRDGTTN